MMIKNEPVGMVTVKMNKKGDIVDVEFHFPELDHEEECWNCKKLTRKTRMGLVECEECQFYDRPCDKCEYGIEKSTFCCNGDDLEDHFEHWIACGIRQYNPNIAFGEIVPFNPESSCSSWGFPINVYKQCFKQKKQNPEVKR